MLQIIFKPDAKVTTHKKKTSNFVFFLCVCVFFLSDFQSNTEENVYNSEFALSYFTQKFDALKKAS